MLCLLLFGLFRMNLTVKIATKKNDTKPREEDCRREIRIVGYYVIINIMLSRQGQTEESGIKNQIKNNHQVTYAKDY